MVTTPDNLTISDFKNLVPAFEFVVKYLTLLVLQDLTKYIDVLFIIGESSAEHYKSEVSYYC